MNALWFWLLLAGMAGAFLRAYADGGQKTWGRESITDGIVGGISSVLAPPILSALPLVTDVMAKLATPFLQIVTVFVVGFGASATWVILVRQRMPLLLTKAADKLVPAIVAALLCLSAAPAAAQHITPPSIVTSVAAGTCLSASGTTDVTISLNTACPSAVTWSLTGGTYTTAALVSPTLSGTIVMSANLPMAANSITFTAAGAGTVQGAYGTAALPSITVGDSDTGFYRVAQQRIGITTAGVLKWIFYEAAGHFAPNATNTYDVGLSSNTVRTYYAGTSVVIGSTAGGGLMLTGVTFGNLGTPANGTVQLCTDCDPPTLVDSTCTHAGTQTGALAVRVNGAWKCIS